MCDRLQFSQIILVGFMEGPVAVFRASLLVALSLCFSISGHSCRAESLENEISGFVLDRSITRVGHEFTRYLTNYRNMRGLGDYNLTVYERPSARWGNLIWVEQDNLKVFQIFLFPSTSDIKNIAENAMNHIHQQVQRQKLREVFDRNYDLADDEF